MTCQCGKPLPPMKRPGFARKWCSESCRVRHAEARRGPVARTCNHCGEIFRSRKVVRYCSDTCKAAAHRVAWKCEHCGEEAYTVRSERKRFCSDACAKATRKMRPCTCQQCGTAYTPKKSAYASFCSRDCSFAAQRAAKRTRLANEAIIKAAPRSAVYFPTCRRCEEVFTARTSGRVYCSDVCHFPLRPCTECGQKFTALGNERLCSDRCRKAAKKKQRRHPRYRERKRDYKHRRRALIAGARTETVYRRRVFERDGYRCGICGKPTKKGAKVPDPLAPTLDHIVPISKGGSHSYINTQCAHFSCNTLKRDRSMGEQLLLVG